MNLFRYARRVVVSTSLDDKLRPPDGPLELPDTPPPAERIDAPGRPPSLEPVPGREVRVPPPSGMADPSQRARILHALANHELQAVELFAWAALAFPEAPAELLRGLMAILVEEQRHTGLYLERLDALGVTFGDFPVTAHFWRQAPHIDSPLSFMCTMGLTFENANLDFARELAEAARAAGDEQTADVLHTVHADEIRHVRFGWRWLERLRDEHEDAWQAYVGNVAKPLGPARARGATFDRSSREAAGLDEAFIDELEAVTPRTPAGDPR